MVVQTRAAGPVHSTFSLMKVECNDTIRNVKAKLQEEDGFIPDCQGLIFADRLLKDAYHQF